MKKQTAQNLLFATIVAVLFFGIIETTLRLTGFEYMPDETPLVVMRDFQRDTYKTLYRFDEATLWSLKPEALYNRRDGESINSLGFRSPDIKIKKTPGTLRVACLGDSSAFGFGMPRNRIYTHFLQQYLEQMLPGTRIEVINGGVVGFTSTQALARLRRDILPLKPDVVVVTVGAINEIYKMKYTDAQRIALVQDSKKSRGIRNNLLRFRTGQLMLKIVRSTRRGGAKQKPQHRTPLPQFRSDLEAFAGEARKNNFLLVLVSPHRREKIERKNPELENYTAEIHKAAKQNNLPLVDVRGFFRSSNPEEVLFKDDYHPSATGHYIIAQMLAAAIVRKARAGKIPGFNYIAK